MRAFWFKLNENGISGASIAIKKAMAAIANVTINDAAVDVTYDDVRKVLMRAARTTKGQDEKNSNSETSRKVQRPRKTRSGKKI